MQRKTTGACASCGRKVITSPEIFGIICRMCLIHDKITLKGN